MARSGIGQDGYTRIQKEVTYGTPATNSMTAVPFESGAKVAAYGERIENMSIISSRLKQAYDQGRNKVTFEATMKMFPSLFGLLSNLFLGTSTDTGPADSAYVHTFKMPVTGENSNKSFTLQMAKGADLACQLAGCVISKMNIKTDNQGHVMITISGAGQSYTESVARVSTAVLTYPAIRPIAFDGVVLKLTPSGGSQVTVPCNSIELDIDLALDTEDYKTGSLNIQMPVYKSIPKVTLKASIDADNQYKLYAQQYKNFAAVLTMTARQNVGAGTTPYKIEFELPNGQLNPETEIPYENDRLKMDLEFDFSLGGVTTGSPSTSIMAELRVTDIVTAYA